MFSLAGFPPTVGFSAKYYPFAAAVTGRHTELAIMGVVSRVILVGYYIRVVVVMFMYPSDEGGPPVTPG